MWIPLTQARFAPLLHIGLHITSENHDKMTGIQIKIILFLAEMVKTHCTLLLCQLMQRVNCFGRGDASVDWLLRKVHETVHRLDPMSRGTCDIFGVDSLPLGRESPVCETIVRLKADRYRVAGTDHQGRCDVTTVRPYRGKEEALSVCVKYNSGTSACRQWKGKLQLSKSLITLRWLIIWFLQFRVI